MRIIWKDFNTDQRRTHSVRLLKKLRKRDLECRSSTVRETPTKCSSQSAVRRLFQEKPAQRIQEDIPHATSSRASGSRRLSTVINSRISPILFIESGETDSSEDMTTNAQVFSHCSSEKPVSKEENMPEVELLTEIHGLKRGHERLYAGFHDLPTPPRPDSISNTCEKMFDNCNARKSLEGLLGTPNICDISTQKCPRSASKLSLIPLENSDLRVLGIKLKEDDQNRQEKINLRDLSTPKCLNNSVKLKDNFMDKCPPRHAVCVRENGNPQEFRSEDSVNENAKTSNSRTNHKRITEGINNRVIQITSNDNLRQIGQFSISRFDGSSNIELEGHSSGPKKSVLLLGCGKDGVSLANFSTESRKVSCERRSIFQESGNSLVRSNQGGDGISNRNSEPPEIDLVSDSSEEEKLSPCPKRIEYDSRKTGSVVSVSSTLSNDREALLAFSRARWKARNKIHMSVETTESSVTKQSLDSHESETVRHRVLSSQNILVPDPNTTKETSPISRTPKYHKRNSVCEKQDKYNKGSSTLHESVDSSHLSLPLVQDRPTLKPATLNNRLQSGCSPESVNVISPRHSKIGACESQIPIPKENKLVHQTKQILPSEKFSPVSNQENIVLSVSWQQQPSTADKERDVVKCVSSQSNIVPGHLNEISRAGSGTRYVSMPASLQSCDVRVNGNDISRDVHDRVTHTVHFVSDLRLPKRQLESKTCSVETSVLLCNSTASQKYEEDRPVLSNAPNQDQSSPCYSVNLHNNQSKSEILPVFGELDSTVSSRCPTNPEISLSEVINYFPEHEDSAVNSTECLTRPKFKNPSHLSAHCVPSHRSSRDVSLTVDQNSLTSVPGQFSEQSPTHRRIVVSNSSGTMETNFGIHSSVVNTSNSVVKESSAGPLSGERALVPLKEKIKSRKVGTNFRSKTDCHIDNTSQSRNESADKGLKRRSYPISPKYFELFKRTPIVKLHKLDERVVQTHLKSTFSSPKQDSENLKDGSKKRKTCSPKKLHTLEKYSNYGSFNDIQKTPNNFCSSLSDENDVTCGTLDAVGVRSEVSDAKTNQQLLRRKMFSLARGDHREDQVALKSNGILMNHQEQTSEGTNTSGERKISPDEAARKEDCSFTGNIKRKQIDGNGKRKLKRCDVCWRNVENVTEHIINDHKDMFYSKNNL